MGTLGSAADLGREIGFFERLKTVIFGEAHSSMLKPVSVAKNRAGLLVVADPSVPTVHFFDLEARRYRRLGRELASLLRSPVGVAVDDAGRAYVSDSVRGRVFVFDEGDELVAEMGEGLLERPTGLALGPAQERLYVVDTVAGQVVVFNLEGRMLHAFGKRGVGLGEFNFPTYITVMPDGTLAVSDSLNFRVQILRTDGTPLRAFGQPGDGAGDFSRPKGVAADSWGRLYVVDAAFENVQIFSPDGILLLAFGEPGTGPGEFYLPTGLFLDSSNTIWVADSFNARIQVFRLLGDER
jgi:DNA-binding beta-propeller fold protein YncE